MNGRRARNKKKIMIEGSFLMKHSVSHAHFLNHLLLVRLLQRQYVLGLDEISEYLIIRK